MTLPATFSPCGRYRYTLHRDLVPLHLPALEVRRRTVVWIMLNPSTADDRSDDPTIRRVCDFSMRWGYQDVVVVNAYAVVSTDPRRLWKAAIEAGMFDADGNADPVGPDNDAAILAAVRGAELVVCGWGRHLQPARQAALARLLAGVKLTALARNGDGTPSHPLRLPASLEPQRFKLWEAVDG